MIITLNSRHLCDFFPFFFIFFAFLTISHSPHPPSFLVGAARARSEWFPCTVSQPDCMLHVTHCKTAGTAKALIFVLIFAIACHVSWWWGKVLTLFTFIVCNMLCAQHFCRSLFPRPSLDTFFLFLSEHELCCDVSCAICEWICPLRQCCKSSGCSAASLQSQGENTQTAELVL